MIPFALIKTGGGACGTSIKVVGGGVLSICAWCESRFIDDADAVPAAAAVVLLRDFCQNVAEFSVTRSVTTALSSLITLRSTDLSIRPRNTPRGAKRSF